MPRTGQSSPPSQPTEKTPSTHRKKKQSATYLPHARPVVLGEPSRHPIHARRNIPQLEPILFLRIRTQVRNGQNLLILNDALLEFPVEDPETGRIVRSPKRIRETRHGSNRPDLPRANNSVTVHWCGNLPNWCPSNCRRRGISKSTAVRAKGKE